jgi:hypothetical protein
MLNEDVALLVAVALNAEYCKFANVRRGTMVPFQVISERRKQKSIHTYGAECPGILDTVVAWWYTGAIGADIVKLMGA